MITNPFFVCQTYFFIIYANILEIVYTFVSIYNANGYEVLRDGHKYFTFRSPSYAFTSMIT